MPQMGTRESSTRQENARIATTVVASLDYHLKMCQIRQVSSLAMKKMLGALKFSKMTSGSFEALQLSLNHQNHAKKIMCNVLEACLDMKHNWW